jgi:hypothetical protein
VRFRTLVYSHLNGIQGERVDWIPYLLPSHNVPSPFGFIEGAYPSQAPDYQWGSDKYWTSSVLENIMDHEPLAHRRILYEKQRILYISPGNMEKLAQDYDPVRKQLTVPSRLI